MPLRRLIAALRQPPKAGVGLGRLIAAVSGGLVLVALVLYGVVFYPLMEATNTTEFCISCHSMQATVYQEYKKSVHYSNRAGVRAGCPDCHVPKQLGPKLVAKVRAAKDVWHEMLGTIDTPEKFEAHRWRMANTVWAMMERTDSATCRSCHTLESMDLNAQDRIAARRHRSAMAEGKACIACHKALVHKRPRAPEAAPVAATEEKPAAQGNEPAAGGNEPAAGGNEPAARGSEPTAREGEPAAIGADAASGASRGGANDLKSSE